MVSNKDINWIYGKIQHRCENAKGTEWSILQEVLELFEEAPVLSAGVAIVETKPEKPPTDLRGKCGGCDYAVTVPACGSTFAYVQCTNPQHLATYGKRYKSGIRQRTTKACKKYRQREGL